MRQTSIYEQVQRQTLEGRELEASVLFRGAQKLNQCAREWQEGQSADFQEKLANALEFNQKVWSFLQVELGNPANPMPEKLRLNLLQLSKFIDKRIFALFAGTGSPDDLLSIARINEQIGAGLQTPSGSAIAEEIEPEGPFSGTFMDIAG